MILRSIIILFLFFFRALLFAQESSDILYIEEKKISKDLIGRYTQIDFYNNSFGKIFQSLSRKKKKLIFKTDTLKIKIDNKEIEFIEVRNDTGFNNWFSDQYLESVKTFNEKKLRIEKMKILSVDKDKIEVKLYAHYFDKNGQSELTPYITKKTSFDRNIIYELLIDGRPPINKGISIYRIYHSFSDSTNQINSDCKYCFVPKTENLFRHELISEYDIEKFDYENQQIILDKYKKTGIKRLKIPLEGMPVVLTLNGEIIYGFWLWNKFSSFGCDRIYTYPKLDFKLKFGLPENNQSGSDPRFDKRLKTYLETKK